MSDGNPPQGLGEEEGPDLATRLSDMSPERLAEEVISVWEEVLRVEGELATARQRGRALEMELDARESSGSNRARVAELEEALRVANSRIAQMETLLENERVRRVDTEVSGEKGRFAELQDENARLLRSEEEHVMLILDMEAQLERLVSEVEDLRHRSSQ
jgi:chromosome segregation ATPase